jgi:hypothetical protein
MDESDENFNYEYDDRSLDMFLAFLITHLDVVAKRRLVSVFLEVMGTSNQRHPLDRNTCYVRIGLSDESRSRARMFLEHVESIFFHILPPQQEELYQCCINFRDTLENDMTGNGYVEFLKMWNRLIEMTGLPFSLEEDFGGLKNWDAWNDAVEKAMENCKTKFAASK